MSSARKSLVFLAIAFGLSWGVVFATHALGWAQNPTLGFAALTAMMFGPAIAALVCAFWFERGRVREALGLRWSANWWWIGAWLIGLALCAGAIVFTALFFTHSIANPADSLIAATAAAGKTADAEKMRAVAGLDVMIVLAAAVLGAMINAPILSFSEELGWRGYLHGLWRPSGFWRTSLGTGAIWGVWHGPAIVFYGLNYPDHRLIGVPIFIVFCTLLGPIMTFVRDRGASVIAAGILHGTINAMPGIAVLMLDNPPFPWSGVVGVGGFISAALGVALIAWRGLRASPP